MEIWIFQKFEKNHLLEKKVNTLSKPEKKINELWNFLKNKLMKIIKFSGFAL